MLVNIVLDTYWILFQIRISNSVQHSLCIDSIYWMLNVIFPCFFKLDLDGIFGFMKQKSSKKDAKMWSSLFILIGKCKWCQREYYQCSFWILWYIVNLGVRTQPISGEHGIQSFSPFFSITMRCKGSWTTILHPDYRILLTFMSSCHLVFYKHAGTIFLISLAGVDFQILGQMLGLIMPRQLRGNLCRYLSCGQLLFC